jgi:uncharacterized protein
MAQSTLLSDTPVNLIQKYRTVLVSAGIPVKQMILFGSYAKNMPHAASDLDVCVVSESFGPDAFAEMVRLAKLAHPIDALIEPHPYTPEGLLDKWDPLAQEIRTHGVVVS